MVRTGQFIQLNNSFLDPTPSHLPASARTGLPSFSSKILATGAKEYLATASEDVLWPKIRALTPLPGSFGRKHRAFFNQIGGFQATPHPVRIHAMHPELGPDLHQQGCLSPSPIRRAPRIEHKDPTEQPKETPTGAKGVFLFQHARAIHLRIVLYPPPHQPSRLSFNFLDQSLRSACTRTNFCYILYSDRLGITRDHKD